MAKTKISEYSSTANNNTDINSINLAEGMAPSLVNNAIRTLMAQLKNFQDGSAGDNITVGGNLSVTGTSTLTGALTASGGISGNVTSSSATITGGTINGAVIGGSSAQAITGTNVTATVGFTGPLTGAVTGNTTGTHTGAVTGNVTGNLTGNVTGNVTAASGTSTFNNVTISGSLDMDAGTSATITGLANPVNDSDAANKGYVDALAQGIDAKASVVVATTANITLSGTQTIDGISVSVGDRVLVKDQTTQSGNGIYLCAASTWTRTTDANTWDELVAAFTFVERGTTQANNGYISTITAGGTLGTTAVTFAQFSGAGQITAGDGLTKTGNTLNVGTASSGRIVVNADNIDLAASGVTVGTYKSVTADAYGRITTGTNPTTLSGFGIADAYTIAQIDTLFGSTTSAATSAAAAATSASNASTSATNASTSAGNASTSATNAAASATSASNTYDAFDDRYLGSKSTAPTVDNDGNALLTGALYWNTATNNLFVWTGSTWSNAAFTAGSFVTLTGVETLTNKTISGSSNTISNIPATAVSDTANTSTGAFQIPQGTTAQRPASPTNGMTRVNNTTNRFEIYSSNTSSWINVASLTNPPTSVEYLVVAGGGGGASYRGGAGGAGGLLTASGFSVASNTAITVTVGAGGAGGTGGSSGVIGSDSVFSSITATGGGRGGTVGVAGGAGGSGGGGAGATGGSATSGQGSAGGLGVSTPSYYGAGGGGGASAVGTAGTGSSGGAGGAGTASSITGSSVTYAGGGAGGQIFTGAPAVSGGAGGGGSNTTTPANGGSGTANTGGGGAGAYSLDDTTQYNGGSGGSGIVVIRYADTFDAATSTTGSPTVTVAGGYRVYKFTASGSITF